MTVRDSAGIAIVEVGALPESPLGWTVATEPDVLIGGDTDDERAQLVRVAGAARRSDGRIVVGDGLAPALLLFDADGTPAGSFGRRGGGPGEFEILTLLGLITGDSAVLYDQRQGRFTVVTPEMTLGRMFSPAEEGGGAFPESMLPGGPLVVRARDASLAESPTTGVYDGSSPLLLMGVDGEPLDTLGTFPRRSTYMVIGEGSINLIRVPFGAETSYATARDRLYVGTATSFEILTFDQTGDLTRILRVDVPSDPVTGEDLEAFTEAAVARAPEPARPGIRAMYGDVPVPELKPAYDGLVADSDGNLWVERYSFREEEPTTWTVFAPDGDPLGTVTTPAGVTIHEIGADYLLGSGADALDRAYVGVWRLDRGGR